MAEQKIELRKVRDFGENISDTILFIKQNFKPLVSSFFTIAGIFLLTNAVLSGLHQSRMGGVFEQMMAGRRGSSIQQPDTFTTPYFLLIFFSLFSMNAMHVAIISYIKVYERKNREAATIDEVWQEFKKYFFKVFFYSIPVYLLMIIGLVFCLAPGIWLWVVLLPFPVVLMIEDETFGGAFNRCFQIIKQNFWSSFGIYIVVILLYLVASTMTSGIMGLISGVLSYLTTKDISTTIGVTTSVLSAVSFVFYIVFYVAVALHYFTLSEKYDGTGMMRRLDKLGQQGQEFDNNPEKY